MERMHQTRQNSTQKTIIAPKYIQLFSDKYMSIRLFNDALK